MRGGWGPDSTARSFSVSNGCWRRLRGRSGPVRALQRVVRVQLVNGRTLWMRDVQDDDEDWLRGTNTRGREVLLSRTRVQALRSN